MRTSFKLAIALATTLAAAYGIARSTPYWFAPRQAAQVDIHDPALIAQGQYLSRAADCAACHTAPGGKPFAGGLGMQTPMGTIYSTNITPDPETASAPTTTPTLNARYVAASVTMASRCIRQCRTPRT